MAGKTNSAGVQGPGTWGGVKTGTQPAHGSLDWQVQQGWITKEAAQQQQAINAGGWDKMPPQQAPQAMPSQGPSPATFQPTGAPMQLPQPGSQGVSLANAQPRGGAYTPQYLAPGADPFSLPKQDMSGILSSTSWNPQQGAQAYGQGLNPVTSNQVYQAPNKPQVSVEQATPGLQAQVKAKQINQQQMDAQLAAIKSEWDSYNQKANQGVGPAAVQAAGFDMAGAQRSLQEQVNKGWITQAQMDQQMAINQQMASPQMPDTGLGMAGSIAGTQGQFNQQNAQQQVQYNRVNEFNPYGQSTYKQNPDGSYSRVTELSPQQQQMLEMQQQRDIGLNQGMGQLAQRGVGNLQNSFDYSKMPKALGMEDLQGDRRRVEDQIFGQYQGDIEKDFTRQMDQERQRLANMGIPEGSQQYSRAMEDLQLRKQDALNRARTAALTTGRAETESMFDMGDRARTRGIGEAKDLRYMPLDEVARLGALSGGITNPSFSGISQVNVNPVDYGAYAQNFGGQDYGLGIYKDKAQYDMEMQRQQYEWQQQQQKSGRGRSGGGSAPRSIWDV